VYSTRRRPSSIQHHCPRPPHRRIKLNKLTDEITSKAAGTVEIESSVDVKSISESHGEVPTEAEDSIEINGAVGVQSVGTGQSMGQGVDSGKRNPGLVEITSKITGQGKSVGESIGAGKSPTARPDHDTPPTMPGCNRLSKARGV
jgi:hypothetical protein